MSAPSSEKTCVVCGKDCTHSPRVKDPRGRYFCKPCYEEALKRARETAHAPGECPECDAPLEPGAVLCVNCGYILKSGKHITPQVVVDEEERKAEGEEPALTKWPIVIGILSLVFAFFGAMGYGFLSIAVLLTGHADAGGPLFWAFGVVSYPMLLVLSIGLGVLAIGLMLRRIAAPIWLARWAWAKIGVSVLFAAVGAARLAIAPPPELAEFGIAAAAVFAPVTLVWMLFWPVFLLLWLRRKKIQAEVARWSGSSSDSAAS